MCTDDFYMWLHLAGFRALIRPVPRRTVMWKSSSAAPDALENDILTVIKSVCAEMQEDMRSSFETGRCSAVKKQEMQKQMWAQHLHNSSCTAHKGPGKLCTRSSLFTCEKWCKKVKPTIKAKESSGQPSAVQGRPACLQHTRDLQDPQQLGSCCLLQPSKSRWERRKEAKKKRQSSQKLDYFLSS